MGWKNWPSWLRGGIIFSIFYSLIYLIILIIFYNCKGIFCGIWIAFSAIPIYFFYWIFTGMVETIESTKFFSDYYIFFIIINFLIWFFIGAIIGWIIVKIKSKNQSKQLNQNQLKNEN